MRQRRWGKRLAGVLLAGLLALAGSSFAAAEETREKITDIYLDVLSTIEAGSSSGKVYVTSGDGNYWVQSTEILNDDDDWQGGMIPRVEVTIRAASGYYFYTTASSAFHLSGDDASFVTARREDERETMILIIKLGKLENGDLSVSGAQWSGSDGTASWNTNPGAKYYQVRLYRDGRSVTGNCTAYDNYYDFAGDITSQGDYYFTVRAVGSESEKGDWDSSDSWYVSSREADEISYGHTGSGPGESGGPGGGYVEGGPGGSRAGSGVGGVASTGGNHWCLDQRGRWYQYAGGGYPVNRWEQIDGKWYCFGEDRYLRYGWINWNGKWYYTGSDGAMLVNCRTPDNYYVGGDGAWIQ